MLNERNCFELLYFGLMLNTGIRNCFELLYFYLIKKLFFAIHFGSRTDSDPNSNPDPKRWFCSGSNPKSDPQHCP
jgi:hypothetical protein